MSQHCDTIRHRPRVRRQRRAGTPKPCGECPPRCACGCLLDLTIINFVPLFEWGYINQKSMFVLDFDDGLNLRVRPYSFYYDYGVVWRSTRQVLIFGSVSTLLLSVLYETVMRHYFGNINGFGTILILRTASSAVMLLVLATITIVYNCFHEGASCCPSCART